MPESLRICFLSAEIAPYAKVGGLADVAGSLPKAVSALGHEIILVLPRYGTVEASGFPIGPAEVDSIEVRLASETIPLDVTRGLLPDSDIPVYFLGNPDLYGGGVYEDSTAADNTKRFAVYSLGSLELLRALRWRPDVIHLNDNHVGLVPLYLKHRYADDEILGHAATAITVHNLAYQGTFPLEEWSRVDLPPELAKEGSSVEAWGQANMLKAGLLESDVVSTVSETYAEEIQTVEYGAGLDGVLRSRRDRLFGILNGADYSVWDPRVDPLIPHHFGPEALEGKEKNKRALLNAMRLAHHPDRDVPVIGLVSRLVEQKGFDIIEEALPDLLKMDLQMVFLGTGEPRYQELLSGTAARNPEQVAASLAFDNGLAHLIEAGSDMFLMPSRFEPSGLNQIYSLRYGTVPIVRATGGLADTVEDYNPEGGAGSGFVFQAYEASALVEAVRRAVQCYGNTGAWTSLVRRVMTLDFSWGASANKYVDLYREAVKRARGRVDGPNIRAS